MERFKVITFWHILLAVLSLSCGISCPLYFGWYDECVSLVPRESVLLGWDVSRDLTDLYLLLVAIGFVHLGFAMGILHLKSNANEEFHKLKIVSLFAICTVWLLTKILLIAERTDTAWNSPCSNTRLEWWIIFSLYSTVATVSMILPWIPPEALECVDENTNVDDRQPLIEEEEADWKKPMGSLESIGRLLGESLPDLHLIIVAFLCLMLAAGSDLFNPWFVGKIINDIVVTRDVDSFHRNLFIIMVVTVTTAVCTGMRSGMFSFIMARMGLRIRTKLFNNILQQETAFFDQTKTGDITNRLSADCQIMVDTLSLNINIFLRSSITAIGSIIFMVKLSWNLSLLTLIGLPFGFLLGRLYGSLFRDIQKRIQDSLASASSAAEEAIGNIRTVRVFANESGEGQVYYEKNEEVYGWNVKRSIYGGGFMAGNIFLSNGLAAATLWYGGHLILHDRISGDALIPFVLYQLNLGSAIGSMGAVYTGLMQAVGAAEKVFQLFDRKSKMPLDHGDFKPEVIEGAVEFANVNFSYPTRPNQPVLRSLSFKAPSGQVTALVGSSGGGKSSIVALLTSLYRHASGKVLLDGVDVGEYGHECLHRLVTVVQQEPVLFARSIKENIMYGPFECGDEKEEMTHATKLSAAYDFIANMADGFDTQCGEKGQQLSGGQKQRIAIARSIVRKPCVLILDEATSALDAASEHLVQEALDNIQRQAKMTIILIAHRLSTVKNADQIVVIDKGAVVETGTHDELMTLRGHYAQLVARQLESASAPPEKIIEREIVEKETIIEKIVEKEKIVGKSTQHSYDSL